MASGTNFLLDRALNYVCKLNQLVHCLLSDKIITAEDHRRIISDNNTIRQQKQTLTSCLLAKNVQDQDKVITVITSINPGIIALLQEVQNAKTSDVSSTSQNESGSDTAEIRRTYSVLALTVSFNSGAEKKTLKYHITNGGLYDLKRILDCVKSLDGLIALANDGPRQTSLHACLMRKSEAFECFTLLLEKFEQLGKNNQNVGHDNLTLTLQMYVDHQDSNGDTIAHMAAKRSSVAILLTLRKRCRSNFFLKNNKDFTAIRLIYLYSPEVVSLILDEAIIPRNTPFDSDFTIELDLSSVIGIPFKKDCIEENGSRDGIATIETLANIVEPSHSETALLAEFVDRNGPGAKSILSHILVQIFVELKWAKLKKFFLMSMILQIVVHVMFTLFVIQVFLINCRHGSAENVDEQPMDLFGRHGNLSMMGQNSPTNVDGQPTDLGGYLFGDFVLRLYEAFDLADSRECNIHGTWVAIAVVLFVFGGIVLLAKEILELFFNIKARGLREGFRINNSVENFLQALCAICIIWVTSVAFLEKVTASHYTMASIGVLASGGVVVMQLGKFSGLGVYVQLLGKISRRLSKLMALYLVIILAFSVSFSIMFPQDAFKTLPQAISKVLVMMIGEFDYDDIFYPKQMKENPSIPFTGHLIFGCFAMLLTLMFINLLIGMVVSDVTELKKKSQVLQVSVKIYKLFLLESYLIRCRTVLLPLQRVYHYCRRRLGYNRGDKRKFEYLDMYVISFIGTMRVANYQKIHESFDVYFRLRNVIRDKMTVFKRLVDIPKDLRQPLLKHVETKDPTSDCPEHSEPVVHSLLKRS